MSNCIFIIRTLLHPLHYRHDKKLSPRSFKGVFLGIPDGTKGYLILDPTNNEIIVTKDVRFFEQSYKHAQSVTIEEETDFSEDYQPNDRGDASLSSRGGENGELEDNQPTTSTDK